MTVISKILQVILALSILIVIHELGHFLFSKLFKIRVDKFYLFFDAGGFRLFSTKHNKLLGRIFPDLKNASTDYGIGWLPLGGYCKISGMVDESVDKEQLEQEPKEYEFRTHPAWQRLLVMAGGVLFNFIFAVAIYSFILANWGQAYVANEGNSIYASDLAKEMGFRTGDRILRYDDYIPEDFSMLQPDLARRSPSVAVVARGKDTVTLCIDNSYISDILKTPGMFSLAVPFVIDSVSSDSPNADAGLRRGDKIESIAGQKVSYVQDSREILGNLAGQDVCVSLTRDGESLDFTLKVDSLGRLGVITQIPGLKTREYGTLEAIPAGFAMTFDQIGGYVRDLRLVATPSTGAYKSVGSFIAIGQVFPSSWNTPAFLYILALLSIMLGVMNLIPIPGLDGGHIVLTLCEMISGHKPSLRFQLIVQYIGMFLLLMLMFLAFGNDITRLLLK